MPAFFDFGQQRLRRGASICKYSNSPFGLKQALATDTQCWWASRSDTASSHLPANQPCTATMSARLTFIVDIHHRFSLSSSCKILLTAGIEICAAGPALIYWRAFAGTAVPESAFVMVANLLIVNAGSHLH